ncbi:hypothetical protein F2P81_011113 [Scophthalmus maximus]|uniref:Uncharacterized protein n=1 Tax=Scophthalmus maximus TaxID=52904 RepID=A0A6A4SXN9_SCOMX|nr:hypothetical protein F2P81_011113 [Scophthalmus maximus]
MILTLLSAGRRERHRSYSLLIGPVVVVVARRHRREGGAPTPSSLEAFEPLIQLTASSVQSCRIDFALDDAEFRGHAAPTSLLHADPASSQTEPDIWASSIRHRRPEGATDPPVKRSQFTEVFEQTRDLFLFDCGPTDRPTADPHLNTDLDFIHHGNGRSFENLPVKTAADHLLRRSSKRLNDSSFHIPVRKYRCADVWPVVFNSDLERVVKPGHMIRVDLLTLNKHGSDRRAV